MSSNWAPALELLDQTKASATSILVSGRQVQQVECWLHWAHLPAQSLLSPKLASWKQLVMTSPPTISGCHASQVAQVSGSLWLPLPWLLGEWGRPARRAPSPEHSKLDFAPHGWPPQAVGGCPLFFRLLASTVPPLPSSWIGRGEWEQEHGKEESL